MIFFTADTHYGHRLFIDPTHPGHESAKRPFASVEAMDEALVRNWNRMVNPEDTVYHLGDVGLRQRGWENLKHLNGIKHLVRGNHDPRRGREKREFEAYFETVCDLKTIKTQWTVDTPGGPVVHLQKIVLCHYPMVSWDSSCHGSWQLHGHSHGTYKPPVDRLQMDVGVDCFDFAPVSLDRVAHILQAKALLKSIAGLGRDRSPAVPARRRWWWPFHVAPGGKVTPTNVPPPPRPRT